MAPSELTASMERAHEATEAFARSVVGIFKAQTAILVDLEQKHGDVCAGVDNLIELMEGQAEELESIKRRLKAIGTPRSQATGSSKLAHAEPELTQTSTLRAESPAYEHAPSLPSTPGAFEPTELEHGAARLLRRRSDVKRITRTDDFGFVHFKDAAAFDKAIKPDNPTSMKAKAKPSLDKRERNDKLEVSQSHIPVARSTADLHMADKTTSRPQPIAAEPNASRHSPSPSRDDPPGIPVNKLENNMGTSNSEDGHESSKRRAMKKGDYGDTINLVEKADVKSVGPQKARNSFQGDKTGVQELTTVERDAHSGADDVLDEPDIHQLPKKPAGGAKRSLSRSEPEAKRAKTSVVKKEQPKAYVEDADSDPEPIEPKSAIAKHRSGKEVPETQESRHDHVVLDGSSPLQERVKDFLSAWEMRK